VSDETEAAETGRAEAPAALPTIAPSTTLPAEKRSPQQVGETLRLAGGSRSPTWNNTILNEVIRTNRPTAEGINDDHSNANLAGMALIGPQDEIESMIAAQMIGMHRAAMEAMRRGMLRQQTPAGYELALSQANKCSRTFIALTEALNRHRGKGGQQRVTVEHVHVHSGGQAIVGAVDTGGRGTPEKR